MADLEAAKTTILTFLKEQYPNTYFQFEQEEDSISFTGELGQKVFEDFSDHTVLMINFSSEDRVIIRIVFDQILYNYENIYEITNAFNEKCVHGSMHISEVGGLTIYCYSTIFTDSTDTDSDLRFIIGFTLTRLSSLRSQISAITKFSKYA